MKMCGEKNEADNRVLDVTARGQDVGTSAGKVAVRAKQRTSSLPLWHYQASGLESETQWVQDEQNSTGL